MPLAQVRANFIALSENQADFAKFVSEFARQHERNLLPNCEMIISGGFKEKSKARSSYFGDLTHLTCNHEEADTRIILHTCDVVSKGFNTLLVHCRDTDVLLLLVHFLGGMKDVETWMIAGTAKQRKCYSIHAINQRLPPPIVENILGFHALTGCDTTSSFTGFGKRKCWKVFLEFPSLIQNLNWQRWLERHIARANHQANVWLQANLSWQTAGLPSKTKGWEVRGNDLKVVWTTEPSIPSSCINLISCGCTKKCNFTGSHKSGQSEYPGNEVGYRSVSPFRCLKRRRRWRVDTSYTNIILKQAALPQRKPFTSVNVHHTFFML